YNDDLFEKFDASVDMFRNKEMSSVDDDDGFQLVQSRKKKDNNSVVSNKKAKVSFHMASIRRPQDEYKILVNNSNQPFEHVWLQRSEDGSTLIHPLEKLSVMDFIDKTVRDVEPVKPPPVESTSFKLVQDVKDLKELAAKLRDVNEFAVDLEHNHYRSFQGLTCLMQISTRTEDFIVDTLKLRVHIGPYLREVFKDPTKRKVMHGADRDIIWLQRDFGIYVCNMFDTGQASKVLKLERNSLEYLLRHFCEVAANKEYQNADWRLRPLTDEMLRYAREDTHYLLYIYDLMKRRLLSSSTDPNCPEAPLVEVYQRSYDLCMQLYQKEILTENSYQNIYGLYDADLNGQQLAIVAGLCEWRDSIARSEDESTGYVLPNKVLIEIAKQMPVTTGKLRHLLKSRHPYVELNLGSIVGIIKRSMQNGAAFEPVAKKLKEEHIEMMAARNAKKAIDEEATEVAGNGSISNGAEDASVEKEAGNVVIAGANQNHELNGPSAKEEIKVEQIKSSVSLPFRSFTDKTEASQPIVKECRKSREIPVLPPTTISEPEDDIILRQSDCDVKEEKKKKPSNAEKSEQKTEDESNVELLDSDSCSDEEKDGNEGTMSLSDLSLSFQQCVQTADEKRTSNQRMEGGSAGLVKVTPFDYAAARREARFGKDGSGVEDEGNKSKHERKKAGGGRKKDSAGGERSGDFQMGKRRQAFPATGNRSSTFR
ncbi:hypothetical protein M8C21_000425, partial [Ambrosia artemisiifolia]